MSQQVWQIRERLLLLLKPLKNLYKSVKCEGGSVKSHLPWGGVGWISHFTLLTSYFFFNITPYEGAATQKTPFSRFGDPNTGIPT